MKGGFSVALCRCLRRTYRWVCSRKTAQRIDSSFRRIRCRVVVIVSVRNGSNWTFVGVPCRRKGHPWLPEAFYSQMVSSRMT
jgi:hypothetical protein